MPGVVYVVAVVFEVAAAGEVVPVAEEVPAALRELVASSTPTGCWSFASGCPRVRSTVLLRILVVDDDT